MGFSSTTKDKDKGYKLIKKKLFEFKKKPFVKVGLPQEEDQINTLRGADFNNLKIGLVHEFGSRNGRIPQRSHIRASYDLNKKKNIQLSKRLMKDVILGNRFPEELLEIMGQKMLAQIQNYVRSGKLQPPERGGTALIDTGQYLASMNYIVKKGS